MKKTLKFILILLVLAGAGAAVWYVWLRKVDAPQYQTVAVTRGELTQAVTATGQLNPVTNVQVGCQISGMIAKLFVDFNSQVKAGQVVAQIDPSTYQSNLRQAEGDLAIAKATLELAQVNERRSKQLLQDKLIAQSDYDTVVANLHQAEATVSNKQAALENAKLNLDRCTIYSPVNGIVISRSVDVGQTVAASLSAPTLFQIANDLTKMQIDANVSEADVGGVEEGQSVNFTVDAFPNRTFEGKVVQIRNAPLTVQNVVTYDTVIAVNNDDLKLKPGMTANVSIDTAHREDALKIPNAALRFRPPEAAKSATASAATPSATPGQKTGGREKTKGQRSPMRTVYVLSTEDKDAKPKPVQIRTGINDGVSTEVLEGLKEGDKVVTSSSVIAATTTTPAANPFGGGPRRF